MKLTKNNSIEIKNLNKFYEKKHALKNVNLSIKQSIFDLLGRKSFKKVNLSQHKNKKI